jgi:ribosome-associated protein
MQQQGVSASHIEGLGEGTWILADYGDVVVHIFLDQTRSYFDLESLWGDAPRKSFKPRTRKKVAKKGSKK